MSWGLEKGFMLLPLASNMGVPPLEMFRGGGGDTTTGITPLPLQTQGRLQCETHSLPPGGGEGGPIPTGRPAPVRWLLDRGPGERGHPDLSGQQHL